MTAPLTHEQFDKAYRDVWSSMPSSNRLWRFAEAIYALAAQPQGEPKPEFYCNKCGYFGPDQYPHKKSNHHSECGYMASLITAAQPQGEPQSADWKAAVLDALAEHVPMDFPLDTPPKQILDAIRKADRDVVAYFMRPMLERLHDNLQADLEHGVAWMNDEASAKFAKDYPRLLIAIQQIEEYLSRTQD